MPFGGIANFIQVAGSSWLFMTGGLLAAATVIGIVGWALLEEAALVRGRKVERRHSFSDHRQSDPVCLCTRRLASVRRASRLEAIFILRHLNDPSAVPALLKALQRYNRDVPVLLEIVETLRQLADPRAVPALRALTSGRHYDLMRAARQATQTIEAKSVLLRASDQPEHAVDRSARILLRAAQPASSPETGILLRAGERPDC